MKKRNTTKNSLEKHKYYRISGVSQNVDGD